MSVRTLAVILARAGSKGLPGKNERPLAGKPCVQWTIECAQRAQRLSEIILSTDGDRLAEIGARCGVHVGLRSHHLAGDDATVDDAAREALAQAEQEFQRFDAVALLYGNVPVRPEGLIDDAIATLERTGCDSVQSYAPVGKHHPCWTAVVNDAGEVRPYSGSVLNAGIHRRQDLPPAHIPDGGVIVCTRAAIMRTLGAPEGAHAFFGNDRRGVVTEEGAVIDIDSEVDALVAEAVLRMHLERGSAA